MPDLSINSIIIPELTGNVVYNNTPIYKILTNGVQTWEKHNNYTSVVAENWSMSSCADQGPAYTHTFSRNGSTVHRHNEGASYPTLTISNNGHIYSSAVSVDVNNICRTLFIFTLFNKTYKVQNETYYHRLYVKDYGADDSTYKQISGGAISYNGYTYLTVNLGFSSSIYLGTNGTLDLEKVKDLITLPEAILYQSEYAYGQNFHYAGCTSISVTAVTIT